ncbi:MAG: protein-L-isoaspartate(D-aspartate) O-methyltransferase [Candidatus Omnitrophota bacterium]|jgi:protein-L-isoaspartate(D-aspartate) O-methyltransferase|nr:MAG: protein-L-isoaspartate(D-aspartate) O-methyltransferase [Candidatus Omnitrophota bacterium]
MDWEKLRARMVEEQLINRGINNERVLDAFYKVARHEFVPDDVKDSAYADSPLPIGNDQTISQPYMVALMTSCLDLAGDEKILEIGTGSGYQAAILSQLAKEVFTVERIGVLAERATQVFKKLNIDNIKVKIDDGTLGWPENAPFDRIIITAAAPRVPLPLGEQLKEGGRLIIPIGDNFRQTLISFEKIYGALKSTEVCACVFVPLVGKYGMIKEDRFSC